MTKAIWYEGQVDLTGPHKEHNPSRRPQDVRPMNGCVLLVRMPIPSEQNYGSFIVQLGDVRGKDGRDKPVLPNCGRVVAIADDVKGVVPGDYVFWNQNIDTTREAEKHPQPISYDYALPDDIPVLWTLPEKHVIAVVPHGGDPVELVFDNAVVDGRGISGDFYPIPTDQVKSGQVFLRDGQCYKAVDDVVEVDEEGVEMFKIRAVPYYREEK